MKGLIIILLIIFIGLLSGCIKTCTPETCLQLGKECGSAENGCGNIINCGPCSTGETCQSGKCVCVDTIWSPFPNTICEGETFTQTSNCGNTRTTTGTKICVEDLTKRTDMLIFVSPQYSDDNKIKQSINDYIKAVKQDLGWTTEIIPITQEINNFKKIDKIIEKYYDEQKAKLKACIMVGEDIHTASGGDAENEETPSTVPWHTIGGESSYSLVENTKEVIQSEHRMDVAISLIYPTHGLSYKIKSSQISFVFDKFSKDRNKKYSEDIIVFIAKELAEKSCGKKREIYQSLGKYGSLIFNEETSVQTIMDSLDKQYKMFSVEGHSTPSFTIVAKQSNFYASYLDNLNTPVFIAGGCYVTGWYSVSEQNDNSILDYSNRNKNWFGSKILINSYLRVMILGFPGQSAGEICKPSGHNFIQQAMPDFASGKTLAESVIGNIYMGDDIVIYGDSTFHYN